MLIDSWIYHQLLGAALSNDDELASQYKHALSSNSYGGYVGGRAGAHVGNQAGRCTQAGSDRIGR